MISCLLLDILSGKNGNNELLVLKDLNASFLFRVPAADRKTMLTTRTLCSDIYFTV